MKERQNFVSELCIVRRMASMRESRDSDRFLSTHKYNHMHCCAEGLALHFCGVICAGIMFMIISVLTLTICDSAMLYVHTKACSVCKGSSVFAVIFSL